jgi:CRISPR-associated endonuclease/helicase Cas3
MNCLTIEKNMLGDSMEYYAHINDELNNKQTVLDHLKGTAKLASQFADDFNCNDWGYLSGMFHDIGKYTKGFQKRLLENGIRVDHSTAGSQVLDKFSNGFLVALEYCIAGHHAGLMNGGSDADTENESTLHGRLKKKVEKYSDYRNDLSFMDEELQLLIDNSQKPDSFFGKMLSSCLTDNKGMFSFSFFIRMLFSSLVDADYLDTETFMNNDNILRDSGEDLKVLWKRLYEKINKWLLINDEDTINGHRNEILRKCIKKAENDKGLFQLTVPTGGGKTISSLAFALKHANLHNMKRVIYVIPYTSIIEQNAEVFEDLLGENNVLQHHSNVEWDDSDESHKKERATENWDKPIIVTTNVQFFESFYSKKTSMSRKLHNVANSVIIFDEAQMLPIPYLRPCISVFQELIYNYGSSVVLCTATQPALERFISNKITVNEICDDKEQQYDFFKRVNIVNKNKISENQLFLELNSLEQVLCIVNNRKHAQKIYESISGEGVFCLSTLMYPLHRKRILDKIRLRLKDNKRCLVISTSLVEAGVDLDFPIVYREIAGLDSIIQAAGRCNREGKNSINNSNTFIFEFEDNVNNIPYELKQPIAMTREIMREYKDISSLNAIHKYFDLLYGIKGDGIGTDKNDILLKIEESKPDSIPFADISKKFKIIENNTKTIFITKEEKAQSLEARLECGEYSKKLLRQIGYYSINVYENDFNKICNAGLLNPIEDDLFILTDLAKYTDKEGLIVDQERGDGLFF